MRALVQYCLNLRLTELLVVAPKWRELIDPSFARKFIVYIKGAILFLGHTAVHYYM